MASKANSINYVAFFSLRFNPVVTKHLAMSVWVICTVCITWLRILFWMPEFARNICRDVDDSKNLPDIVVGLRGLEARLAEVRSHPSGRDVYFQVCTDPLLVGVFLSRRPLELKLLFTVARLQSTWSPLLNSFGRVWRNCSQAPTDCSPTTNANRLCRLLQPFLEATLPRWSRSWGRQSPGQYHHC